MADQPAGEKALPASPKKIQQARERGNVAKSQDLNSGFLLLFAGLGLFVFGPLAFQQLIFVTQHYFGEAHNIIIAPNSMQPLLIQALLLMAPVVAPLFLTLMAAGIAVNLSQIGFLVSPQALQPKFERLNPLKGFKRFVSVRSLVELIKSLSKLTIIGLIAYFTLRSRVPQMLSLMHQTPWSVAIGTASLVFAVWWRVGLAVVFLGLLDFAFQRWQHGQDLRMTHQEARDELKQLEGDPRIKQRVRQIQRQMAMQRMMVEVPEADVIVTNPTTYAVALRYDVSKMEAPRVVAKGARRIAEQIRDLGIEHDVPIVERPELARALFQEIEIGAYVPDHLFRAVAEVLAYIYRIDRRVAKVAERMAAAAG